LEVLAREMLRTFESRMVTDLASSFPQETGGWSEEEFRCFVNDGINRAARYEISTEDDVQAFLECMLILGPDFDVNPKTSWAGDILRSENIATRLKMRRIKHAASARDEAR
jgi:plasmid stability protein